MKKIAVCWILISFALVLAAAGKLDVEYRDSRFLTVTIETGEFETFHMSEKGTEFVRYGFSNSNNANTKDDILYEILQLPLAIGSSFPDISVKILESKEYEHQVTEHDLYQISGFRSFRDQDFIYISINPFLENSRVATKLLITVDLKEKAGKPVENKSNRFFINKSFADGLFKSSNPLPSLKKTTSFSGDWLDIRIDEEGLYSIERSDLNSLGISSDFDDDNVYLYAGPGFGKHLRDQFPDTTDFHLKQVPLLFLAGASEENDRWIFYGAPNSFWKRNTDITDIKNVSYIRNSYEDDQHFRLFIGTSSEAALRMEQKLPQFTGSEVELDYVYRRLHFEEELINPAKGGELWLGERLSSSNDFQFYLNNLYVNGSVPGAIRLSYGMTTKSTHNFNTYIGGVLINNVYTSTGKDANDYEFTSNIIRERQEELANNLLSENLTVNIQYQGSQTTSEGFLDYIDIIYPAEAEAIDGQLDLWFMRDDSDRKIEVNGLSSSVSYVFTIEDPYDVEYYPTGAQSVDIRIPASDRSTSYMIVNESHFKTPATTSLLPDFNPLVSNDHSEQVDFIIITPEVFLSEANRLADFKETRSLEPLTTMVKSYSDIVGQYNAGNRDPYAIWHFLADMYANAPAPKPLYVLLLGDGHFDYQNRIYTTPVYIPYIYDTDVLWPCDDIFVMVDSKVDLSNDMAIGRIPANSYDEVRAVVDKIIEYDARENPGEWQLNTMLVADDPADPSQDRYSDRVFISDSEALDNEFLPNDIHTKKVYLTDYPERYITELQTMGRDGAREDIMENFLNGVSLVNYYGHGDPSVWAQEKVFVNNDLSRLDVNKQYPMIIGATCSWGRSDNPDFQSMAEEMVTMEENGAIATLATVRSVFHGNSSVNNVKFVEDIMRGLFEGYPDHAYSPLMGDAVLYAKNRSNNLYGTSRINNNMKFMYFGDPTLIPAFTQQGGIIDSISLDSLRALDRVMIYGRALTRDSSSINVSNINGIVTIFDNESRVTNEYQSSEFGRISEISFYRQGNRLFNGNVEFDGDHFTIEAFIPKDIQYHGTSGKIRLMYWDESGVIDGSAALCDIHVGGINPDAEADIVGPEIGLFQNSNELGNGAIVFDTSIVKIVFNDNSGINITGTSGHVLEMSIDNDQQVIDLSDLFSYVQNDFTQGEVAFSVSDYLDEGEHLIAISAFDNYNNYSNVELNINVLNADDDIIQNMVNFPNPFSGRTDITFSSAFNGMADLRVYTISGKPVNNISEIAVNMGFNAIPYTAEDEYGHPLAAGVYFYVLEIDTGSEMIKQHSKMVILP